MGGTYKEQGRKNKIQEALKQLHWQVYESETSMPEDLCYLSGKYLADYLHDVEICQAFARRSREIDVQNKSKEYFKSGRV